MSRLLYFLLLLPELVLLAAVCLPLALFAPSAVALIVLVGLLCAVIFLRPAKRLTLYIGSNSDRIERRYKPKPVPDGITLRPGNGTKNDLSPAEVYRLISVTDQIPADRLPVADFTATLLDLNRRGVLTLRLTDADDLLRADGMRIILTESKEVLATLSRQEQCFLKLLRRAGGAAGSVQLSAFTDYVSRSTAKAHRDTIAFRRAVDHSLFDKHCIGYLRTHTKTTKKGKKKTAFARRRRVITRRGEQLSLMWATYYRNICKSPFLDSYPAHPGDGPEMKPFAAEAERLLVDAAAVGVCAVAADALMREYLFEPSAIFPETHYFSSLTETRYAFAGAESGEAYFFLPLRKFESAIRQAVLYGTEPPRIAIFDE